jgi:hypothetical protein
MTGTSRMNREVHVRICGRLEVEFLRSTRRSSGSPSVRFVPAPTLGLTRHLSGDTLEERRSIPTLGGYSTSGLIKARDNQQNEKLPYSDQQTFLSSGLLSGRSLPLTTDSARVNE